MPFIFNRLAILPRSTHTKNLLPLHLYYVNYVEHQDFQQIMDNATNGVIYFSLGTVLQESSFPVNIKYEFLNLFGELKQTVIWKCKQFTEDKPNNVHFFSWVPQQSILGKCSYYIR